MYYAIYQNDINGTRVLGKF